MIESVKNGDGSIIAYIEWQVVNAKGDFQDQGSHIYIQDLWIHKDFRGKKLLAELIGKIDRNELANHVLYIYWNRDKYNHRLSKSFTREVAARKGAHYERKQTTRA